MPARWFVVLLAALTLSCSFRTPEQRRVTGEVPAPTEVGPPDRPAQLFVPSSYRGEADHRVAMVLGDYDRDAQETSALLGLQAIADERDTILILADGTVDGDGARFWNATEACCDFDDSGVDDLGYLQALFDEVHERLDTRDDYVVIGHGAGGFMASVLACEPGSAVRGLVSIGGSEYPEPGTCDADDTPFTLLVHALDDDVVPFDGEDGVPGADEVLDRWAQRAGCAPEDERAGSARRDYLSDVDGDDTTVTRLQGSCSRPIELWELDAGGHEPAFHPRFARDATAFGFVGVGVGS